MMSQSIKTRSVTAPLLLCLLGLELGFAVCLLHHRFHAGGPLRCSRLGVVPLAVADFDGDWKPDVAFVEISNAGRAHGDYDIHFQFSTAKGFTVRVSAPTGELRVAARDVNSDDLPDVVVTSAATDHVVAVFLNHGHGTFSRAESTLYPRIPRDPGTFFRDPDSSLSDRYTELSLRPSFDGDRADRRVDAAAARFDSVKIREVLILSLAVLQTSRGRSPPCSTCLV